MDKLVDAALNMALFGNVGGKLFKGVGLFGSIFGGFLSTGGPAKAGKSYIVGEKGPELFTPGVSGTVSPNSSTRRFNKYSCKRRCFWFLC